MGFAKLDHGTTFEREGHRLARAMARGAQHRPSLRAQLPVGAEKEVHAEEVPDSVPEVAGPE